MFRNHLAFFAIAVSSTAIFAACGTGSNPTSPDAGSPGTGGSVAGNSLVGTYAFSVTGSILDTQLAHRECGFETVLPDGSLAAFAVVLANVDNAGLCTAFASNTGSPPQGQPFVSIQVASSTYTNPAAVDAGSPAPITPGSYSIGYEGITDDDLCSLKSTAGQALVDVLDWGIPDGGGAKSKATALSGTVTIKTISSGHVAGSFSVQLAAIDSSGNIAKGNPIPLSGTFDAAACSGDAGP